MHRYKGLELIGKNLGMFSETEKKLTQDHYNSVPSNSHDPQSEMDDRDR